MAVTPIAPATQELTEITLDLGTAQRPSETQSHVSDRVVRNSARPSATPTATVPAQQKMPRLFLSLLYTYFFLMGANYTVVLPTVSTYTHSLGGGYWTAGLIVAVFMGPSIIITPLMPRLLRSRYMPLFSFAVVCQFVGNVCYGLGQLADSVNLLIAGRFLAGLVAMGPMLYLFIDATSQCSHRQFRTATIARRNNCAFLGMGMGPVLAAGLSKVDLQIGSLHVDNLTSPGWFFAVLYVILLGMTVLVAEPKRHFAHESDSEQEQPSGSGAERQRRPVMRNIAWCCLTVTASSGAISMWETSAAIVTQTTFGWPVVWSSLFIGALFLSSTIGGELVRHFRHGRTELNIVAIALILIFGSSLFLYWYLPKRPDLPQLIGGGEVPYIIGGILLLNAANVCRTFATTIAQRTGSSVGAQIRKRTTVAISIAQAIGRTSGALIGLGMMEVNGGMNIVAAIIGSASLMMLLALVPDQPRQSLMEA